jgi:hypothetical protein
MAVGLIGKLKKSKTKRNNLQSTKSGQGGLGLGEKRNNLWKRWPRKMDRGNKIKKEVV